MSIGAQSPKPARDSRARAASTKEKLPKVDLKRLKAIGLIEQTAIEASLWDDREAAVSAMSEAADVLWNERQQARVWLKKAWDLIDTIPDKGNSGALQQFWRGSSRSQLRSRVLLVAHKHDSKLADSFLKSLENLKTEREEDKGLFDDRTARSEQLLQLAMAAMDTSPGLAESLAERSLQDGISFNLQTVLLSLRNQDPGLANRLFDAAVLRLTNSPSAFSEGQILASYMFRPGQIMTRLPDGTMGVGVIQGQMPSQTPAQSDPARARQFLTAAHALLIFSSLPSEQQSPVIGEFMMFANSLAEPFNIYAPELWPAVANRAARFVSKESRLASAPERIEVRKNASADEVIRLRVDALEKEAEREADPVTRKLKFAKAALATAPLEFERGKRIVERIDDDKELVEEVTAFLFYRAALTFLAANEVDKAEATALRTPQSLERSVASIAVARRFAALSRSTEQKMEAESNRQRALTLLFDAENSLKRESASTSVAKVRLGKVAISQLVDVDQATADLEQAIAVVNRLDKFDPNDNSAPRLGVDGFGTSQFTVPRLEFGFGFSSALKNLVAEDFDRTSSVLDNLVSPSIRGACRIELAKQVLQPSTVYVGVSATRSKRE
jgi:hypothetical protein